ncbi:uncharacterized protein KNAG_0D00880 [Huiozyma naganishii CBS 8797]|uniref:Uncharacterized protein n=1 Tax=Huiozyma naganishii (strain ATCC MYA-139 / BCRC 22969 / CBS 8797 / KCTC 17520 / NBRC 10181 / NCYC 3082 / Yp74L-3) TaxID=1071383 RepID=J7R4S0_HUIN7|nr:hypothetical protein KNAG_0D00880 [Kazachstania naganishii CBS 8797]CCK69840.1 hypothetical protein KNAG_0D00880 [Kazachstania naganishii CBS 8797]
MVGTLYAISTNISPRPIFALHVIFLTPLKPAAAGLRVTLSLRFSKYKKRLLFSVVFLLGVSSRATSCVGRKRYPQTSKQSLPIEPPVVSHRDSLRASYRGCDRTKNAHNPTVYWKLVFGISMYTTYPLSTPVRKRNSRECGRGGEYFLSSTTHECVI